MEEALVGAVVGASIQVLLQNLISKTGKEINLIKGLKKDIAMLENSLRMIQAYLSHAEVLRLNNEPVKLWLQQLQSVAFEADHVMDEINCQFLHRKIEKKGSLFSSSSIRSVLRTKVARKMARKIKDINRKLEIINKNAQSYGLQTAVVAANSLLPITPSDRETDSFSIDPIVVGREDDVSKIVEMLVMAPAEDMFSVIPIIGTWGLGKTTIARKVFNDENMKTRYDEKIWVCVSEPFNVVTLFKMILESLTEEICEVSREASLKKIKRHLENKRYLLVLDDVWSDESNKWDDFISSLSGVSSVKGNGIIVTTRREKVAEMVQSLPMYQLSTLSSDDCWSIIKAKTFKEADVPADFEEIGKNIAQRCKGLPLIAKVVGGLLKGNSKEEWLSILETQLSYSDQDKKHFLSILKLSLI